MFKKASLCLYAIALAAWTIWQIEMSSALPKSESRPVSIQLQRGSFTLMEFPSKKSKPSAIIIFGSGDGGWGGLEESIGQALQNGGYEMIGIDSVNYAKTDYDLDILQSDFTRIAQKAEASYGDHPVPLIIGGYSMGAAQAIAAAGGPHPPRGMAGLLLVDPCSRGRYGLRISDQMNVLPTGPGTFSMDDFARTMGKLRVVQWHAAADSIDSRVWLNSLTAQHREFDFSHAGHDYNNDRDDFLRQLVESVDWILNPARDGTMATGNKN